MSEVKAEKVSVLVRFIAKTIDIAIIVLLNVLLPYPVGVILGFLYTLIHDGIFHGRSVGKILFHLKTIHLKDNKPCNYRESIIRNSPIAVATFFGIIPFWGWILLILMGIPLMILEVYLMIIRPDGSRLGDVMADTKVVAK